MTDRSGMGLFDSGVNSIVSYFSFTFTAAGSYPYGDTLDPALTGTIDLPIGISPRNGNTSTSFTVVWASAPPPTGYVEDVQFKRPGESAFSSWLSGQTDTRAGFTPDAGPGAYLFRARLRKSSDGTHSATRRPSRSSSADGGAFGCS